MAYSYASSVGQSHTNGQQQQQQVAPFLRAKSFSASSVSHRHIVISSLQDNTNTSSTEGSGDLMLISHSRSSSGPCLGVAAGKPLLASRDSMDGSQGSNRGRSTSILQTWFGAGDGLNEVEQAEQEIERMISKIKRDLSHMHDQDLYFAKWIGSLGRKISDLESVVYSTGADLRPSNDSHDDSRVNGVSPPYARRPPTAPSPRPSPTYEVDNAYALYDDDGDESESSDAYPTTLNGTACTNAMATSAYKPLSRSSSQTSAATANSSASSFTTGSISADPDSDYGTDNKLAPIRERNSQVIAIRTSSADSPLDPSSHPRTLSCDSVDSLYTKSAGSGHSSLYLSGGPLHRQNSTSSGIHADELLAMYSKREKGVRQEFGLASQSGTPKKHLSQVMDLRSPSNTSLVQEQHGDEQVASDSDKTPRISPAETGTTTTTMVTSRRKTPSPQPAGEDQVDQGVTPAITSPMPVLLYGDIFEPPPSQREAGSPTSPMGDGDFLTPRLAKRNSGIFGSVRLRQSLRNMKKNKIQPTPDKNSPQVTDSPASGSPLGRSEKTRWRWGSVRGASSS